MRTDLLQEKNGSQTRSHEWGHCPFEAGTKISHHPGGCVCRDCGGGRRWARRGVVVLGGRASWFLMTFHFETFHLGKGSRNWLFLCLNRWACLPLSPTHFWELRKDRLWHVCGWGAQTDAYREKPYSSSSAVSRSCTIPSAQDAWAPSPPGWCPLPHLWMWQIPETSEGHSDGTGMCMVGEPQSLERWQDPKGYYPIFTQCMDEQTQVA